MHNVRIARILTPWVLALIVLLSACSPRATSTQPAAVPSVPPVATSAATAATTPPSSTAEVPGTPGSLPSTAVSETPTLSAEAAALVNGQAVPLQEYEAQVSQAVAVLSQQQNLDPNTEEGKAALAQLRRQILDSLIDQVLIEQAAARENISVSAEQVEAEMARLIGDNPAQFEEWLKANDLTTDTFKVQLRRQLLSSAFQDHIVGAETPIVEQVRARHILLSSETEAMNVLLQLRSGANFSALAQQYSQDQNSKDNGGDLGFFPRGIMPEEIEAVAFGLAPGQVSGIVKSSFGYHIIEVVEKDPSRQVPDDMLPTWRQSTFLQWLKAYKAAAKIRYLIPLD